MVMGLGASDLTVVHITSTLIFSNHIIFEFRLAISTQLFYMGKKINLLLVHINFNVGSVMDLVS